MNEPLPQKLIFTCSGIADVGEIADRSGRRLHSEGTGKMWCMAGIGARLDNFITATSAAGSVLVIDGCPVDCGNRMMNQAGITAFSHIRVTDLGFEKGKSPVNEHAIETVCAHGRTVLAS